jgi:tetratricopeptide (TPR) repeat protein
MFSQPVGISWRSPRQRLYLAIALPLALLAMPAQAVVDDKVQAALALHVAGKAGEAFTLLAPLETERAGDPDFDYALGLAAADSGRNGHAIAALQRVLAVQPNNSQARAEIARVYAMAGDFDTAKTEFDTVIADPSLPDPVRQQLNSLSRNYGQAMRGGPRRIQGFVEAEGGYDSNVNAATSATSITLPVFAFLGPATLGGGATRQSEAFAQVQAGLSAEAPLSRQTKLFASALGLWRNAFGGKAFDQGAATGTVGIAHTMVQGDVVSLSGQGQQYWLARDGFRASWGAIGQYTHRLNGGDALSFALQYATIDYRTDRLRDADRYTGTVSYAGKKIYASIGGGREDTRRVAGRHLGYWLGTAQAGIEQPLSARFSLAAGVSAEYRDYESVDPLFVKGRHDLQMDASLSLRALIAPGLIVRPRVTYTHNASNLALYDYDRVTASISLRKEF